MYVGSNLNRSFSNMKTMFQYYEICFNYCLIFWISSHCVSRFER